MIYQSNEKLIKMKNETTKPTGLSKRETIILILAGIALVHWISKASILLP